MGGKKEMQSLGQDDLKEKEDEANQSPVDDHEQTIVALINAGKSWQEIVKETGFSESTIRRIARKHKLELTPIGGITLRVKGDNVPKAENPVVFAAAEVAKGQAKDAADLALEINTKRTELGTYAEERWMGIADQMHLPLKEFVERAVTYYLEHGPETDRIRADLEEWKQIANNAIKKYLKARSKTVFLEKCVVSLLAMGITPTDEQVAVIIQASREVGQ